MKDKCEGCIYFYNDEYCIYHEEYIEYKRCDLCGLGFRKDLDKEYESQFDKIYQR